MVNNSIIWVLIDERPGNRSQALGVAEALNLPYTVKNISYNFLMQLPNTLLGRSMVGLDALSHKKLTPPWPQLVIAAGRRSAPVALSIKKKSGWTPRSILRQDSHSSQASSGSGPLQLRALARVTANFFFPILSCP